MITFDDIFGKNLICITQRWENRPSTFAFLNDRFSSNSIVCGSRIVETNWRKFVDRRDFGSAGGTYRSASPLFAAHSYIRCGDKIWAMTNAPAQTNDLLFIINSGSSAILPLFRILFEFYREPVKAKRMPFISCVLLRNLNHINYKKNFSIWVCLRFERNESINALRYDGCDTLFSIRRTMDALNDMWECLYVSLSMEERHWCICHRQASHIIQWYCVTSIKLFRNA